MPDSANAWTLAIRPERVSHVPKMVKKNVRQMRMTFHTFNIPRRSWIIVEWTYAEAVSQGRKAAFSTGSHAQGPPQPRRLYAQTMPRQLPMERKSQEKSIHLRVATIHSLSSRPVTSAAIAKEKGTAELVNPV